MSDISTESSEGVGTNDYCLHSILDAVDNLHSSFHPSHSLFLSLLLPLLSSRCLNKVIKWEASSTLHIEVKIGCVLSVRGFGRDSPRIETDTWVSELVGLGFHGFYSWFIQNYNVKQISRKSVTDNENIAQDKKFTFAIHSCIAMFNVKPTII